MSSGAPPRVSASSFLQSNAPTLDSAAQFDQVEIRQLVLEYLASCCYADSARAFAEELSARGERPPPAEANANRAAAQPSSNGAAAHETSNGSAPGYSTRLRRASGMDGVEGTPPPAGAVSITLTATSPTVTRNGNSNGNGAAKAVAFEDSPRSNAIDDDSDDSSLDEDEADCGVLSREQFALIKLRRNIRNHILYGRIQQAVELLTSRFPSVLDPPPSATASSSAPKAARTNGNSSTDDPSACDPYKFFTPPPLSTDSGAEASLFAATGASPLPIVGESFTPECLSLEPTILALNLQLQIFIECMRAAYTSSAPSTPTSSGILPPLSSAGSDGGMSGSTGSLSGALPSAMHTAIVQSQKLNAMVKRLPVGKTQEAWKTIAIDVSGLLAYKELRDCPVRGYMAQSRRETLAELVNAAVLQSCGQTPLPLLALATKQTSAVWDTFAEFKPQFPPPPAGVKLDKSKRVAPYFDLGTFLSESDTSTLSSV